MLWTNQAFDLPSVEPYSTGLSVILIGITPGTPFTKIKHCFNSLTIQPWGFWSFHFYFNVPVQIKLSKFKWQTFWQRVYISIPLSINDCKRISFLEDEKWTSLKYDCSVNHEQSNNQKLHKTFRTPSKKGAAWFAVGWRILLAADKPAAALFSHVTVAANSGREEAVQSEL